MEWQSVTSSSTAITVDQSEISEELLMDLESIEPEPDVDEEIVDTQDDLLTTPSSQPPPVFDEEKEFIKATSLFINGDLTIDSLASAVCSHPAFTTSSETSTFTLQAKRKLPLTLKSMIGEAHVQYARGFKDNAIALCMQVIKEQPTCVEPYNTLAMIYEGEPNKSLQFSFIAAFLQPRQFGDWGRIAELSLNFGKREQAIICYKRAIVNEPNEPNNFLRLAKLYEELGDTKSLLKLCLKISQQFETKNELCVEVLRKAAIIYHDNKELETAYSCLFTAITKHTPFISPVESNLFLDLCVTMKRYVEALEVLIKYLNVKFVPIIPEEEFESREKLGNELKSGKYECKTPSTFPTDLLAKLITILVHLEAYSVSDKLSLGLISKDVNVFGDLFLDVAESYMAKRNYEFALNLLLPLIRCQKYSQAAVWLRYAECLFLLVRLEEAAVAYEKVVSLAPTHSLAKLNLSVILQKLGRNDAALETLSQDKAYLLDPELVLEKCHILYKGKQYKEFIDVATMLLLRNSIEIKHKDDALVIVMVSNFGRRYEAVEGDRVNHEREVESERSVEFLEKSVGGEREFEIYLTLISLLHDMERWDLVSSLSLSASTSFSFSSNPSLESEIELHSFLASGMNADIQLLPQHVRIFLSRSPSSTLILNLFCLSLQYCDNTRFFRHVLRLIKKYPEDNRLVLLNAHMSSSNGMFRNALMEYLTLFAQSPNDPLLCIMISVVLTNLLLRRGSQNKLLLALNISAFLNRYLDLRGKCQESYYNVGRALHQLGHYGKAMKYYELALAEPPVVAQINPIKNYFFGPGNPIDLKAEIAYNLSLIYRQSGNIDLARSLLYRYNRV